MNKVLTYGETCHENLILALGYFDAVHKGHKKVLKKAVDIANQKNATPSALIFIGGKGKKDVFTLPERLKRIFSTGIKTVIVKELSPEFKCTDRIDFLKELTSLYNIDGVVSGSDFTFGCGALGKVETLVEYFGQDKVNTEVLEEKSGEKISTTAVKKALEEGDVLTVNTLLDGNYFISGEVIEGKKLGKTLGFPTANILIDKTKFEIGAGVYVTFVILNGKIYPSITNCGNQPTVDGENTVIETYIDGYNGDLYGKILTVYFVEKIRDIVKFNSLNELKEQLEKDLRSIK